MRDKPFTVEVQRASRVAEPPPDNAMPARLERILERLGRLEDGMTRLLEQAVEPAGEDGGALDEGARWDGISSRLAALEDGMAALLARAGNAAEAAEAAPPPGPAVDAAAVETTLEELAALTHPGEEEDDPLTVCANELGAVVRATEGATDRILAAAEAMETAVAEILAHSNDPSVNRPLGRVRDAVVEVYEASNFQDITGQRIAKVRRTLEAVESGLTTLIAAWGPERVARYAGRRHGALEEEKQLLNGPQMEGQAISQDEIDALFD